MAGCPLPATKLQKYVFLLRHETFIKQDSAFYDFLPYKFAKSSLSSLAAKLGIGYLHCPELGIPSSRRKEAQAETGFMKLFSYYEKQILPAQEDHSMKVAELMKAMPSALLCMEREAVNCHRGRLAKRISALSKLDVVHL